MPDQSTAPDTATVLQLLCSHTWHPDMVAACLRQVSDCLSDTRQHGLDGWLGSMWVTAPDGERMMIAELIGKERRTAKRPERACEKAEKEAKLEQWRASRRTEAS